MKTKPFSFRLTISLYLRMNLKRKHDHACCFVSFVRLNPIISTRFRSFQKHVICPDFRSRDFQMIGIGFNLTKLTKQQAWSCSRFKFILRYKEIVKRNENGLVLILDSWIYAPQTVAGHPLEKHCCAKKQCHCLNSCARQRSGAACKYAQLPCCLYRVHLDY